MMVSIFISHLKVQRDFKKKMFQPVKASCYQTKLRPVDFLDDRFLKLDRS
jgi:hypothetical protein